MAVCGLVSRHRPDAQPWETNGGLVSAVAPGGLEEALGTALLSPRGHPGQTLQARQRAAGPRVPIGCHGFSFAHRTRLT